MMRQELRETVGQNLYLRVVWNAGAIVILAIITALTVNYVRPNRLPIFPIPAINGSDPSATNEKDLFISLGEAESLFFSQGAVFVDARSEGVFELGHIQGAVSLPWDDFENRYTGVAENLPIDWTIITYCDGEGCSLSHELALALLGKGHKDVRILSNGWTLWQQEDLPVDR